MAARFFIHTRRPPFTGTLFCWRLSKPQGHNAIRRLTSFVFPIRDASPDQRSLLDSISRGLTRSCCAIMFTVKSCFSSSPSSLCGGPSLVRMSRGSVVGIAIAYGLDDRGFGFRIPVASRIFISPYHPDRLCGPPNLLSKGRRGLFPRG
jgi:hypothetical protein